MYKAYTSALPFKDKLLRSQVPTWVSTLACTSDQFHSSWRPGPNHTRGCRQVHNSSGKALAGERHPFRHLATNLRSNQNWLLLSLRTSQPPSSQPFMFKRRDTKTVISSAYAETFAVSGPTKGIPCNAALASSSLNLRSRGSKARILRKGDRGQPCQTDCSITKASERFLFTCTTACR